MLKCPKKQQRDKPNLLLKFLQLLHMLSCSTRSSRHGFFSAPSSYTILSIQSPLRYVHVG